VYEWVGADERASGGLESPQEGMYGFPNTMAPGESLTTSG
jgi:hypothetical protein